MSEQPGPSQERGAIKNDPLSFREVLEQHAKDSAFVIHDINLDVVVPETTGPGGTRHKTTIPVIVTPAENLKEIGLQVLIGEGGTYAVYSDSRRGMTREDGNQTIYSKTRIVKLPDGFPLEEIKRPTWAAKIDLYYSHQIDWVAGAEHGHVGSQKSGVQLIGKDEFLEKFLALLERIEPTA